MQPGRHESSVRSECNQTDIKAMFEIRATLGTDEERVSLGYCLKLLSGYTSLFFGDFFS